MVTQPVQPTTDVYSTGPGEHESKIEKGRDREQRKFHETKNPVQSSRGVEEEIWGRKLFDSSADKWSFGDDSKMFSSTCLCREEKIRVD